MQACAEHAPHTIGKLLSRRRLQVSDICKVPRHDRRRGRCEHRMLLYAQQPLRARHTMCNTRSQADQRVLELIVVEKTVVGVAVHVYRHAHRHANRHAFRRAPYDQWTFVIEAVAMSHRQLFTNIIDTLLAMSRQSCCTQGANPRHSTQGANCNKGAVGLPHPRRKLQQGSLGPAAPKAQTGATSVASA